MERKPVFRKRIGTDVFLEVKLSENGLPAELGAMRDFVVTISREEGFRRKFCENYRIEGDRVFIQVNAEANRALGIYGVSIQYDRPDALSETGFVRRIHDIPRAFEIVSSSTEESEAGIELESGVIGFGKDGADAFEAWKARTGNPDASIDDFIAVISAPLRDMEADYDNGFLTLKI